MSTPVELAEPKVLSRVPDVSGMIKFVGYRTEFPHGQLTFDVRTLDIRNVALHKPAWLDRADITRKS